MYGVGIRLGVYLQAAVTILAQTFAHPLANDMVKTGALFQFAMLVSLVYNTADNPDLYAIEALVIYLFSLASLGVSTDALWDRPRQENFLEKRILPSGVAILRQTTVLGIDCFQVRFWFKGLEKLKRTDCRADTFFFARVDMYGSFRTFAKVFSMLLMIAVALAIGSMVNRSLSEKKKSGVETDGIRGRMSSMNDRAYVRGVGPIIFLVLIVLAVELTITWNGIRDVNSVNEVGQLIPLIIAVGTCMGMLLSWPPRADVEP
jgi:hypothetical protein